MNLPVPNTQLDQLLACKGLSINSLGNLYDEVTSNISENSQDKEVVQWKKRLQFIQSANIYQTLTIHPTMRILRHEHNPCLPEAYSLGVWK